MKVGWIVSLTAAGLLMAAPASAHNYLHITEAHAGYMTDLEMRVPHGCKGSPVNEVRIKIPEGVGRVRVENSRDWEVELKMRPLPEPVTNEAGITISETVDEIVWKNPTSAVPDVSFERFAFRAMLPNKPDTILFFRTVNNCVEGDDRYIDLPEEEITLDDPDFAKKFWDFMSATATPAPYVILRAPERPQYPWEWGPAATQ